MINVFLSSTFRDLKREREILLDRLEKVLYNFNMEQFIPDARDSQQIAIENLRKADVVIFLISPYYGSFIDRCTVSECSVGQCPVITQDRKISYTHCEYKIALAEGKLHQTYFVDNKTDVIRTQVSHPKNMVLQNT